MPNIVLQRNLNEYNVKDFGATGNGSTDDTSAIQAAINAAPAGSTVFFPAGTYLVSSTIQLVAVLAYIGTTGSYGGATIKQKNASNLPAVIASYEWYNNSTTCGNPVRIENLTIDCNSANNTTSHGIVLMNYDSIIRECTVINAPACSIVNSSVNRGGTSISNTAVENRIESCKVDTAGQHGIWIQDNNGLITDGYIDSCIVSGTTQDGIRVDRAAGYFIQHNHVYAIGMNGYNLNNCWDTFVIGNEVDGYGQSATANYYAGISAVLLGPRASVFADNIICVNYETNDASNYQHLNVTGGGVTDTKAIVAGNAILGGYVNTSSTTSITAGSSTACTPASMDGIFVGQHLTVGSDNITVGSVTATTFTPSATWPSNHGPSIYFISSNKSQANSTGITYQSNSTQQASGQTCTIVSYGNRVEGYGHYSFFDGIALVGPVGIDGAIALAQSQNYQVQTISSSSTITTAGFGSIIVSASSNATGVILAAGTQAGQVIIINNEGAGNITMAAAGTSFVVNGVQDVIAAYNAKAYIWDAVQSLWYPFNPSFSIPNGTALTMYSDAYTTKTLQLTGGTVCYAPSSSTPTLASSGTITTSGVGVAKVTTSGAVTGVILQAGTTDGQIVTVINTSGNSITMAASGTSHVADGTSDVIAANNARRYTWNATNSLWYPCK